MKFHENRLLADESHETSYLIFFENWERFRGRLLHLRLAFEGLISSVSTTDGHEGLTVEYIHK